MPEGLPQWLLQLYSPAHAQSEGCLRDSKTFQAGLRDFQPWAVRILDSSSKLPSGIMFGHVHDLGNFDQCFAEPSAPFSTQFCLVNILNVTAPVRSAKPHATTIMGGLPYMRNPVLSFCLPASCSNTDVESHFSHIASPWNMSATVDPYGCTSADSPPLDSLDWFAIGTICFIALLVSLSSAYDLFYTPKASGSSFRQNLLLSFSAVTNLKRLCSNTDPERSLAFLGGLRFLSMFWVVAGHHVVLNLLVPAVNYIVPYKDFLKNPLYSPLLNAMLAVDTFLVITGMLIAYIFLQEVGTNRLRFQLLPFYLHRIIRVTPALCMIILMGATLSSRVGDGPLWHMFYTRHQADCRANGWTNLLFLNNYVKTDNQCASFTWYLCVDMHLYFLSPLILFPLLKHRMFARVGLPLLILAATVIDFFVAYTLKLPAGSLMSRDLRTADNYRLEYTTTHTRAAAWLVGIALGYILHSLKTTKFKLSPVAVALGWSSAVVLGVTSLFGMSYFHQDRQVMQYNALESSLYISLHRVAWSMAVAWLMFACETGYAGPIRTFLAHPVFQPLGRLAFSLYLVHGGVEYMMVAYQRAPAYTSPLYMLRDSLGELLLSIVQAIFMCVGVEAPFIRLEKALIRKVLGKEGWRKKDVTLTTDLLEIKHNSYNKHTVTTDIQRVKPAETHDILSHRTVHKMS